MIKYFCDRCGKETNKEAKVVQKEVARGGKFNSVLFVFDNGILCEKCAEKFDSIKDKLKREEDIFNMTEEEIRLLRCSFKVGDKVITSDGRVGTIRSICYCDRCKERGFYEPKVVADDDMGPIWITDTDKYDGFSDFYSIGDVVFGNLNEECVAKEMDNAWEQHKQLVKQLGLIRTLKEKGWSANEL